MIYYSIIVIIIVLITIIFKFKDCSMISEFQNYVLENIINFRNYIFTIHTVDIRDKYNNRIYIHYNTDIRDENNNIININTFEKTEQDFAYKYIEPNDIVLELGARYGSVSCIINCKLDNKTNQVSVEPDSNIWKALENNKKNNNCKFNIVKGFVSNKKLDLIKTDSSGKDLGYGVMSVENNNSSIKSYTLEQIQKKYNLKFNVLVADCEGFLETFFDENPTIYDDLRLIIFEADNSDKCNYDKIRNNLASKNFINKEEGFLNGFQNVWIKNDNKCNK